MSLARYVQTVTLQLRDEVMPFVQDPSGREALDNVMRSLIALTPA